MRTVDQIYAEIQLEREKLNNMTLGSDLILKQSIVVDKLINEYYRAVSGPAVPRALAESFLSAGRQQNRKVV